MPMWLRAHRIAETPATSNPLLSQPSVTMHKKMLTCHGVGHRQLSWQLYESAAKATLFPEHNLAHARQPWAICEGQQASTGHHIEHHCQTYILSYLQNTGMIADQPPD